MRLYAAGLSSWLANARYRNVKIPVDAIPIDRIRALAAYEPLSGGSGAAPPPVGLEGAFVPVDALIT
jgi:hypothetical protein